MDSPIQWTKTFIVLHEMGTFKAFASEHEGKHFYATIIYFERKQASNAFEENRGMIEFRHHTTDGTSEQEALDRLQQWLAEHLPGKCEIREQA